MLTRALIVIGMSFLLAACSSQPKWYEDPDTHIVRRGETLYSIAFRYGKSPTDLARWNRLGDGTLIHPGQRLRLKGPASSGSSRSTQTASRSWLLSSCTHGSVLMSEYGRACSTCSVPVRSFPVVALDSLLLSSVA